MKKLFSLVAIAAVALTSFTSCDENEPDTPPIAKAKLTLSADANVAVEATGKFTVTSNIDATSDIIIAVQSSDEKILTITTASVTIANGKKSVEGSFKGIADGKAKITIEAIGATLSVSSVDVTVGGAIANAEIVKLNITPADGWPGFLVSDNDESVFFNFFEVSYMESFNGSISMDLGKGNVMGLGSINANGFLCLEAQPEGKVIKLSDMISAETERPVVWSADNKQNHTALATGEDVYIVVACGNFDSSSDDYRAWLKINIKTAGGWSSLNVIDGYVCLDESEFKVGQTK